MTRPEQKHIVRVAAFATILLTSLGAFFFLRTSDTSDTLAEEQQVLESTAPGPVTSEPGVRAPHLREYPEPDSFARFIFSSDDSRIVTGECKDAYFTVLIYPVGVDYRENPRAAFHNKAEPCSGDTFSTSIPTPSPPYVLGDEYYVIRAHQALDREWYDAY